MSNSMRVVCLDQISKKMKGLIRENLPNSYSVYFCEDEKDKLAYIKDADALITFTKGISKEWIDKANKCRFIQKLGAGVNNIDIDEASKQGIYVANTRGLNSKSVAEHAVLLMLAVYKQLCSAHNGIALKGKWLKTELRDHSYQLSYKKVGLIGLGNIGKEVVQLLRGFKCDIYYYDVIRLTEQEEERLGIKFMDLTSLIKNADVISLHVPLTEGTHHLINEEALNNMKETSILINTCRGPVIDEKALFEALSKGGILGAGLDVFAEEPMNHAHPFTQLENIVLTPHIGGGTVEAMAAVAEKACKNIVEYLEKGLFYDDKDIVNLKKVNN